MRIHICATVLVTLFSYFYRATATEFLLLIICIGFVITSEMVNTAIETIVNLESPSYNSLAKIAKDVAAGAVAIAAIVSAIVGGVIFLKADRLVLTFQRIIINPLYILGFLGVIVLSLLFIFNGPGLYGEKTTRIYDIKKRK